MKEINQMKLSVKLFLLKKNKYNQEKKFFFPKTFLFPKRKRQRFETSFIFSCLRHIKVI